MFVLAFGGGFADAGSYIVAKSFTGHLTGNLVLTMLHLTAGDWVEASTCLLAVIAFVVGTALGSRGGGGQVPAGVGLGRLRWTLLIEVVLLVAALASMKLVGPEYGKATLIASLGLALGLQNGILQKLGELGIHTTYMTGISTSLINAALPGGRERAKRNDLAGLVCSFACGAAGAGLLFPLGGVDVFNLLLVPITLVFLSIPNCKRPNLD